ncbi:2-oxoglutarate dehydrogenase E1 component [Hyphobacterium sp. CCMP332]|jgi:2-oxoglutarate dehydrogenase E1 component|uniref:2-oxoglutarate dehydrogenase E1 component n=1 Tax=Hyphobacterium sp. CCMP332 TaxID=2749086 RepID=UPI0016507570|nr:2-oxoglutarate dehydrogenase E1 component [Hyphobacterium sp. CCMP332]QNL20130.1 2-oxoglutarate dehydrogenase E1 component [Hyphobacterium sp. CCMP332]
MSDAKRTDRNQNFLDTSFLYGGNAHFVEQMAASWAENPASVPDEWRQYFEDSGADPAASGRAARGASWKRTSWPSDVNGDLTSALGAIDGAAEPALIEKVAERLPDADPAEVRKATQDSIRAIMMIRAYRMRGHLAANLDPLSMSDFGPQPELQPESYGFQAADMDREIFIDGYLGLETATPREMLDILRRTYCSTLGVEFMHISNPQEKAWLQERFEGPDKGINFTADGKKAIFSRLVETEAFERFLHKRYPGTKRFGIDGGEAMVPGLEQIIKRGSQMGVSDMILGMPHRGRLNVLAAVMGKPYHQIFHEFQGGSTQGGEFGSGDVKYHLGASSDREFDGKTVHLSLTANPSHLEAVDPVVLGKARAKQTKYRREQGDDASTSRQVLPLLLHGDAAFAGQGIVAECFGLSGLKGHRTGGAIHFIVNNQIGFTTDPKDSRSSPYPSDVALMVQAPIFHVNGDDPEAVVYAAKMATEYRQLFGKDAIVDMFCYRRYGHNEGDDPSFTQPQMYQIIKTHPTTRELYQQRLVAEGVLTDEDADAMAREFDDFLDAEFEKGKDFKSKDADWLDGVWSGLGLPEEDDRRGETAVPNDKLKELGRKLTEIPDDVDVHKTLRRVLEGRRNAIESGEGLDWATAESLAFATLLDEGFPVRLSGQDSGRGTFSQRHSHIIDQTTGEKHTRLNQLGTEPIRYEVIDTMLSEEAVLGFEYGYSLSAPNTLVMWEAQFGDFVNGAQVIIDQFLAAGERKWLRMSGLVMLLPHGYEGQGPEHSSARLERFLQLCAQDNMQVANCSTPANYFHILRRQIHRGFRKPLILMTPKSLLRHKKCISSLAAMSDGSSFHRVLWDDADPSNRPEGASEVTSTKLVGDDGIRRVVMCSGKVYYDLLEAREEKGIDDIYLLRVEQFYPIPARSMLQEFSRFPNAELVWCQEEPQNMGAWTFIQPTLDWVLIQTGNTQSRPKYAGRSAAASTAAGTAAAHKSEQSALIDEALA